MNTDKPRVVGRYRGAPESERRQWFLDHVSGPPEEIAEFLSGTSIELAGSRVLDVGCGDGFIDLGIVRKFKPTELVGADIFPTDDNEIRSLCKEHLGDPFPNNLRFVQCSETSLPFPDARFDFVMSWSVFEHVSDPVRLFSEIRRVLRPRGYMFLQIWPLFHSQRGSHLWNWYPEGWEHLLRNHDELTDELRSIEDVSPELLHATMVDFTTLNRITVDELQRAMLAAGLKIRRISATADTIDIPEQLSRYSVVDLMLSGIKVLAVRD